MIVRDFIKHLLDTCNLNDSIWINGEKTGDVHGVTERWFEPAQPIIVQGLIQNTWMIKQGESVHANAKKQKA